MENVLYIVRENRGFKTMTESIIGLPQQDNDDKAKVDTHEHTVESPQIAKKDGTTQVQTGLNDGRPYVGKELIGIFERFNNCSRNMNEHIQY
jgi:hypothetical protein